MLFHSCRRNDPSVSPLAHGYFIYVRYLVFLIHMPHNSPNTSHTGLILYEGTGFMFYPHMGTSFENRLVRSAKNRIISLVWFRKTLRFFNALFENLLWNEGNIFQLPICYGMWGTPDFKNQNMNREGIHMIIMFVLLFYVVPSAGVWPSFRFVSGAGSLTELYSRHALSIKNILFP